ncbi:MAG: hypothetical protein M3R02_09785 [Chloroflexota bacterium]|nr:hypothetical protein [Chloroflexota bacterium]
MSNYERRLSGLEKIWPTPALPATPAPTPDWSQLSEADRADWEEINAAWLAIDLGPVRLDERAEIRARLDGLSDDHVDRLAALAERVRQLTEEERPA